MVVFIFWSEADLSVFGFTSDPTGANLPSELAPWTKNGTGVALCTEAESIPTYASANPVLLKVDRDGFYLARTTQ